MKGTLLPACLAALVLATFTTHAKLREVYSLELAEDDFDTYLWNAKGVFVAERIPSNGPSVITTYKKGRTLGTATISAGIGADHASMDALVGNNVGLYVVRRDDTHWFHTYRLGRKLKKLGEFSADESGDKCHPRFYILRKRLFFQQRQDGLGTVELRTFNKRLAQQAHITVQAGDSGYNGCVRPSPHGRYCSVERTHDTGSDTSILEVYKIGRTLTKLADGITSKSQQFTFHGRSDRTVSHTKANSATEATVEVAKLGSYRPFHTVDFDRSVARFTVDGKGNILCVFTNRTFSLITPTRTLGPFADAELQNSDYLRVLWFRKSSVVFRTHTELPGPTYLISVHAYKIGRKGVRALGTPVRFENCDAFTHEVYDKSIYCCVNRGNLFTVTVVTPRLKVLGSFVCVGENWPDVMEGGVLDRVHKANTVEFHLHAW